MNCHCEIAKMMLQIGYREILRVCILSDFSIQIFNEVYGVDYFSDCIFRSMSVHLRCRFSYFCFHPFDSNSRLRK